MYEKLKESLEASQVVDRNGYQYFIHPLTDGVPAMERGVLQEVIDWILANGDFDCDCIVAPESMGIPLAVPVTLELGVPYVVIRKRGYGLPGEVAFSKSTGYSDTVMTINGLRKGDRVVILDDVVSTGGTLEATIKALREDVGAEIVDILVPLNKNHGAETVERNTGIRIKTMVGISIVNGRVVTD